MRGLSLVAASGGYSSLRCAGFSLQWLLLLRSTGSRCAGFSSCGSRALERRRSSCGSWAQLLRSMGDLPRPGLKPVLPALADGFLTTAPPGKPSPHILSGGTFVCFAVAKSFKIYIFKNFPLCGKEYCSDGCPLKVIMETELFAFFFSK